MTKVAIRKSACLFAALASASMLGGATVARADGTGWFAPAQVPQGRWEYAQQCAVCHGAQLQGGGAPALKGREFAAQWNGKKLDELYTYVHKNMPLGRGASLPSQEYADVVAYILAQSGAARRHRALHAEDADGSRADADGRRGNRQRVRGERRAAAGEDRRAVRRAEAADDEAPTQAELDAADGARRTG